MFRATNLSAVESRAQKYLWSDSNTALVELRRFIKENILPFESAGILGGFVRELARTGKVGFQSDIDFVIDARRGDVDDLANRLQASPNRFGGYGYRHSLWKIDFWALETTWAIRQGFITVEKLSDVRRGTFFDCDAIFYDLRAGKVTADADYIKRLRRKTIEINLYPNPSVDGNLVRAVRRILYWDFLPGPRLRQFFDEHLTDASLRTIAEAERRLYGNSAAEHFSHAVDLKGALFSRERRRWLEGVLVQ